MEDYEELIAVQEDQIALKRVPLPHHYEFRTSKAWTAPREYPDHEAASVLMEARIPYDYLIRVMDVVRSVEVPTAIEDEFELYELFSEISVGDAP